MRIGLMVGPDPGRYRESVAKLEADAVAAEAAGFASIWIAQPPDDFDALTGVALMGRVTNRIEIGTAVVPLQSRHPVAMLQQVLSTQAVCEGRLTLGVGPSHHWVIEDMLGLPYEKPARLVRSYLEVLHAGLSGPGPVDVENEHFRVHNPLAITDITPTPVVLAALAPLMLKIAGTTADGTVLWMADAHNIGEHIAPSITKAAADAGRRAPRIVAGVPVTLCRKDEVESAREWARKAMSHSEYSPNYERLLEHGDATDAGDFLVAGDEADVRASLERYRDAGVTDFSARLLPYGKTREARIESRDRTTAYLASLCPEL
ncbi:MAG TPA: TIGR03564 family F420-dependent LLM class oxidoreductase [Mycobacteriales bacterium]|nr:TIGR03564 family F420-dependent LLM class oxidoreductase [Mycobacteriales bacterium]